jgi:hypothetical protein
MHIEAPSEFNYLLFFQVQFLHHAAHIEEPPLAIM